MYENCKSTYQKLVKLSSYSLYYSGGDVAWTCGECDVTESGGGTEVVTFIVFGLYSENVEL